jgi:hypothetical protein
MLKIDESKRCTYCGQGAVCIYGGQLEHDLARKLEASDMGSQMPANTSENRLYPTA